MYFHDIPANGIGYLFSFLKVFNKIVKISFAGGGGEGEESLCEIPVEKNCFD